jgi:uncharacterized membrane protein
MSDVHATSQVSSSSSSHLMGALTYFLSPLTGIVFLLVEKRDPFIRFHAMQSTLFGVGMIVLWIALSIATTALAIVPVVGWVIGILATLGLTILGFVFWLVLMIQAFQGKEWEAPIVGKYARRQVPAA